jgi:transmembrane sensor
VKYNQYDIEDFLVDKDFIRWVKKKNGEPSSFFQTWLNSNPPNKEKALIARELLLSLKAEYLEGNQEEFYTVMSNLMHSNHSNDQKYVSRPSEPNIWWRWAAIIVMAFSISFVIHDFKQKSEKAEIINEINFITKINPAGQRSQIQLPDGSVVFLNASSKLVYADNFGKSNRDLDLVGEAFFEVRKNSQLPFLVNTGNIYTKALGTSFNIKAVSPYDEVAVTLVTGKVEIGHLTSTLLSKAVLEPGEKLIARADEIRKTNLSDNDIAWKDGVIIFEKASLEHVVQTLQQWYGVNIKVENAPESKWRYSGKFKNNSLEIVLERMSYTEHFKYEIMNDFVTIKF